MEPPRAASSDETWLQSMQAHLARSAAHLARSAALLAQAKELRPSIRTSIQPSLPIASAEPPIPLGKPPQHIICPIFQPSEAPKPLACPILQSSDPPKLVLSSGSLHPISPNPTSLGSATAAPPSVRYSPMTHLDSGDDQEISDPNSDDPVDEFDADPVSWKQMEERPTPTPSRGLRTSKRRSPTRRRHLFPKWRRRSPTRMVGDSPGLQSSLPSMEAKFFDGRQAQGGGRSVLFYINILNSSALHRTDNHCFTLLLNSSENPSFLWVPTSLSPLPLIFVFSSRSISESVRAAQSEKAYEKAVAILKKYGERLEKRNGLGYNHLLSPYGNLGLKPKIQRIWEILKMHDVKLDLHGIAECDDVSVNLLLGCLMKCGCFEDALQLFDEMSGRDVLTWSVVLNGLVQSSGFKGGLEFVRRMLEEKVKPNESVFVGVLNVCTHLGVVIRETLEEASEDDSFFKSRYSSKLMFSTLMNIPGKEYGLVFTVSRGSTFSLLVDPYPFHTNKKLLTMLNHESQLVHWMAQNAKEKRVKISIAWFGWPILKLCSTGLRRKLFVRKKRRNNDSATRLFLFPAHTHIAGARYSSHWMALAQPHNWHVLLDAGALGPKDMDSLGLSPFRPEFIIASFYYVFGSDPTGFGCPLIKKSVMTSLQNTYGSKGSGMVRIVPVSPQYLDDSLDGLDGDMPLLHISGLGHFDVAEHLLAQGADPSVSMELGATPKHHTTGIGHVDWLNLLLPNGADVDSKSDIGSQLIQATGHGQQNAVMILLEHSVNPNIETGVSGETPLHMAADIGSKEIVSCLLNAGVDPNIADEDSMKPIQIAGTRGSVDRVIEHMLSERSDGADLTLFHKRKRGQQGVNYLSKKQGVNYVLLCHGSDLWSQGKLAMSFVRLDVHAKLMGNNKQGPQWWVLTLIKEDTIFSLLLPFTWRKEVQLSWWGMFFAFEVAWLVILPIEVTRATTNPQITQSMLGNVLEDKDNLQGRANVACTEAVTVGVATQWTKGQRSLTDGQNTEISSWINH